MSPSTIAQRTNSVVHEMCNFFACLPHVHAMLHDTLLPSVILRQIFFSVSIPALLQICLVMPTSSKTSVLFDVM